MLAILVRVSLVNIHFLWFLFLSLMMLFIRLLMVYQQRKCRSSTVSFSVESLGPLPADLSASGALDEFRGSATGYDGHPTSSCPVSIFPGKVSIPDSSNEPVSLQNLWDFRQSEASGANIIDSFCMHKILPDIIASMLVPLKWFTIKGSYHRPLALATGPPPQSHES